RKTEVDAGGLHGDVDRTGLRRTIDDDRAARLVELTAPYRDAHVRELDARIRVHRIDHVRDALGERWSRETQSGEGAHRTFRHGVLPWIEWSADATARCDPPSATSPDIDRRGHVAFDAAAELRFGDRHQSLEQTFAPGRRHS